MVLDGLHAGHSLWKDGPGWATCRAQPLEGWSWMGYMQGTASGRMVLDRLHVGHSLWKDGPGWATCRAQPLEGWSWMDYM